MQIKSYAFHTYTSTSMTYRTELMTKLNNLLVWLAIAVIKNYEKSKVRNQNWCDLFYRQIQTID